MKQPLSTRYQLNNINKNIISIIYAFKSVYIAVLTDYRRKTPKLSTKHFACIFNEVNRLVLALSTLPLPTIFGIPSWSGTGPSVSDSWAVSSSKRTRLLWMGERNQKENSRVSRARIWRVQNKWDHQVWAWIAWNRLQMACCQDWSGSYRWFWSKASFWSQSWHGCASYTGPRSLFSLIGLWFPHPQHTQNAHKYMELVPSQLITVGLCSNLYKGYLFYHYFELLKNFHTLRLTSSTNSYRP